MIVIKLNVVILVLKESFAFCLIIWMLKKKKKVLPNTPVTAHNKKAKIKISTAISDEMVIVTHLKEAVCI